uniref:Uncharacterized protein n=1 Tax=uncultured Desulfobacterium sp. TaxID=201089 RepID=E1YA33_9BACT|nr:unknown protein [uncultured Desulfobacterium sp.]
MVVIIILLAGIKQLFWSNTAIDKHYQARHESTKELINVGEEFSLNMNMVTICSNNY